MPEAPTAAERLMIRIAAQPGVVLDSVNYSIIQGRFIAFATFPDREKLERSGVTPEAALTAVLEAVQERETEHA